MIFFNKGTLLWECAQIKPDLASDDGECGHCPRADRGVYRGVAQFHRENIWFFFAAISYPSCGVTAGGAPSWARILERKLRIASQKI
jgi:hypothetical protein